MKRLIVATIMFIVVTATTANGCVVPAITPTDTPSTPSKPMPESDQPSNPASSLPSLPTNNPKETITSTPSFGEFLIAGRKVQGPEEVVFRWMTDRCDMDDVPDFPARAFRDADGKVQLIATQLIGRRMIGDTLDSVQRDCAVVLNSDKDADPSKYNDCEWLASPYTFDGNTIYALVHNEYQGHTHPGMSVSGDYFKNWYNSITFVKSNDKGKNYSHDIAPNHLVASLPYRYVPEEGPSGISIASNIVHNPKDGYFYALIRVFQANKSINYISTIRTRTLDDPQSWRAWDGENFELVFINPYTSSPDEPLRHMPQPVGFLGDSLTFNTYLNKYVAVGIGTVYNARDEKQRTGFLFSLSDDLTHWSPPQLIMEATPNWPSRSWDAEWFMYPSLIDPADTSVNFEITGQEPYLYYTHAHPATKENNWGLDRDLVRVRVRFTKEILSTTWEFDRPGDDEGWMPINRLAPFTTSGGLLRTYSSGNDPYMHFDEVLNLDAGTYNIVEIRMKVSHGNSAGLLFTTVEDEIWDQNKSVRFNLHPGSDFVTYYLDMTTVKAWAGQISQIRLDPTDSNADIEIEYIRIYARQ